MDAARVAKRLGASEAMIIYRRDRAHMPAHEFEADEALAEGVKIHWLRTIKSIDQTEVTVEVMAIGEDGRPRPTGDVEVLQADDMIMALGQDTDTGFLKKSQRRSLRKGWDRSRRSEHDDRPSRPVCRWGHGAVGANGHRGGRPRQESRTPYRRLSQRPLLRPPRKTSRRRFRSAACLVSHRCCPADSVAPRAERTCHRLRRGRGGPR